MVALYVAIKKLLRYLRCWIYEAASILIALYFLPILVTEYVEKYNLRFVKLKFDIESINSGISREHVEATDAIKSAGYII